MNYKKYSKLLERENETLKRKMEVMERERKNAISEKEKMKAILNGYKEEYERLIHDAKTLLERQKKSSGIIDKITNDCKKELEQLLTSQK